MTAPEFRNLRYRLGWSQAEMARNLNLESALVAGFESGLEKIPATLQSALVRIMFTAEANAAQTVRRPIAEVIMREKNLSQLHDYDCHFDVTTKRPIR